MHTTNPGMASERFDMRSTHRDIRGVAHRAAEGRNRGSVCAVAHVENNAIVFVQKPSHQLLQLAVSRGGSW